MAKNMLDDEQTGADYVRAKYFSNDKSALQPESAMSVDTNGLPLVQPVVGRGPASATIGDYNASDAAPSAKLPNDDLNAIKTGEYDANSVAPDMGTKPMKLPADDIAAMKADVPTAPAATPDEASDVETPDQFEQAQPSESDMATQMPSQFTPEQMNLMSKSSKPMNPDLQSKQSLLDQYKALVQQKQDSNNHLGILTGANKVAQAIASGYGAKIDDGSEMVNQLRKNNDLPLEGFLGQSKAIQLQNEMETNDPNSAISGFARENALNAIKRLNPNLTPEQIKDYETRFSAMTAQQLEKAGFKGSAGTLTPYQQQMMEIYKQRIGNTKDSLDFKKGAQTEKISKEDSDLAQKMQKSLDTLSATSRSQLGKAANVTGAARQLDLLLASKPVEKFDNRDMQEMAIITNNLLTNGQTSAAGAIQKLVPKTFSGDTAKWLEFITNEPQSVEAQDFVKNFKNIADRERIAGDKALKTMLGSNVSAFYKLRERQPDVYQSILDNKMNLNTKLNDIYRNPDLLKEDNTAAPTPSTATTTSPPPPTSQQPIIRKAKDGKMYKFDPVTKENLGEVK